MPGRPAKPTAVKKLAGNPGKRALNDGEPKPRAMQNVRAPRHLPDVAKREWRRVAGELERLGLLTVVDRAALEAYCVLYARWLGAEEVVREKGEVLKTSNGNLIQNPYLAVANRARVDMLRVMVEFGMTPSSRSRVSTVGGEEEPSLAEQLFAIAQGGRDE